LDKERARREAAELVAEAIRQSVLPKVQEEMRADQHFYVDEARRIIELRRLHDLLHFRADKGKRFRF
jgi:hypothetical protein